MPLIIELGFFEPLPFHGVGDYTDRLACRLIVDPAMKRNVTRWDYNVREDGTRRFVRPYDPAPEARPVPRSETE